MQQSGNPLFTIEPPGRFIWVRKVYGVWLLMSTAQTSHIRYVCIDLCAQFLWSVLLGEVSDQPGR